ncbi:MAG: ferrochelatase [Planctomycetes bacterium]|nr:ferrochelatase [Planctomycetota bacterium]
MLRAVSARPGVLLTNLGTPDAPRTAEVRRYLREFLSDARVLDMPALGRFALVNGIIAPFRASRSAAAYREVWGPDGSPLLAHSLALRDRLRERLAGVPVALGMRYGTPSLASALDELVAAGCERIVCAPLYPQYASSTTGSSLDALYRLAARPWNTPYLEALPPFYDDARYLEAVAAVARPVLDELAPDHVLFSFHGLPERHVQKSDPTGAHCLASADCCARIVDANRNCYRAQCFATAAGLVAALGLDASATTVAFQSRLGRTPWLRPYTDETVRALAAAGTRRLAVLCPAFTADCLETLEEIGIRAREDFVAAGGEALRLVPSLNAHPAWVEALAGMLGERLRG